MRLIFENQIRRMDLPGDREDRASAGRAAVWQTTVGPAAGINALWIATPSGFTAARSTTTAGSSLRTVQQPAFTLGAGAE
jgi:hypothetical protein